MRMDSTSKLKPLVIAMAMTIPSVDVFAATDSDRDGLSVSEELAIGTLDTNPDSDGGGANDGWEVENGFDPLDPTDDVNVPDDFDSDNDGILDEEEGSVIMDLDSDQDGIPDTIEAGLVDEDFDGFLDNLSDINNNGMPDVAEALAVSGEYPDFDGDGTPDYLDRDSDNDGVYDILEYDTSWAPEGYPGNPLDVDGDGMPNAMDVDSDNDGIFDFNEQFVYQNEKREDTYQDWLYVSPTVNAAGQVYELSDDDGDGIINAADASGGHPDVDGDGIRDKADIDRPLVWNRQDDCVLYYCYLVRTYDTDGDGIENDYEWDINNDGALDTTEDATFYDTGDGDGIPAIFDDEDTVAYVVPEPVTEAAPEAVEPESVELEVEEPEAAVTPVTTPVVEPVESEPSTTPSPTPAPAAASKPSGGAFSLWALLALCWVRAKRPSCST